MPSIFYKIVLYGVQKYSNIYDIDQKYYYDSIMKDNAWVGITNNSKYHILLRMSTSKSYFFHHYVSVSFIINVYVYKQMYKIKYECRLIKFSKL
jgi:hypothetical protein